MLLPLRDRADALRHPETVPGVRITTGEFVDYYGQITLGPESGLPVCWLDFQKVQRWRGGDERSFSSFWQGCGTTTPGPGRERR
jgi:hypothetical protein